MTATINSYIRLSEFDESRFAFTPILVELNGGKKAAILEAELEDYPGRFLRINEKTRQGFISDYARYPLEEEQGGHNNLQAFVAKRAEYIAKTDGNRTFPWRAVVVSTDDKQLLDNDMVYKLASPSRVEDISWIKPGQLAWDWWNDWNISGVDFRAIHSMPMSQGTRCHQLAMYIVCDSPLVMLADNPTAYKREQESVDFITRVPTVFDRTIPLDGKVGEYVALARQKEDNWNVGVMTNWDSRQITVDFSFLPEGEYNAVISMDGVNADRDAADYRRTERTITHLDRLTVSLSTGGGWAARLDRK